MSRECDKFMVKLFIKIERRRMVLWMIESGMWEEGMKLLKEVEDDD
jgi:hypothetical protein